jgi:hypothetical protein
LSRTCLISFINNINRTAVILLALPTIAFGVSGGPGGSYELPRNIANNSCPFITTKESLRFDSILIQIRSQLDAKIQGQENCQAQQRALYDSISNINDYYADLDSELTARRTAEIYQTYLNDMQAQLIDLQANQPNNQQGISLLQSGIYGIQSQVRNLSIQGQVTQDLSKRRLQQQVLSQLNNAFQSLQRMDARCVEASGGWQNMLSPLLSTAALSSGYSVLGGQVLASSILQLTNSMVAVLTNRTAKKAFESILRLQNEKVLACSYFSILHASCEIKRAHKLADQSIDEIRRITARSYRADISKDWQDTLELLAKTDKFEAIFNSIATQGSSLSLETDQVAKYFAALKIDFESLKPYPDVQDPDELKIVKWLNRADRAGVRFPNTNNSNGQPYSTREKLAFALTSIKNNELVIENVQATLAENKSFEGLKNQLMSEHVDIKRLSTRTRDFLLRMAAQLPRTDQGSLRLTAQTLDRLVTFLDIGVDDSASLEEYLKQLSDAGGELFKSIAQGSVAQISLQQILALGNKSQERLLSSFRSIENFLNQNDIDQNTPFEKSFAAFKQEQTLFYQLANIYNDLKGTATIDLHREIGTSFQAFEMGFEKEIQKLLEVRLKAKDPSAAHYCSLFSGFLNRESGKNKSLLDACKQNFQSMPIHTLNYESTEKINYNNSCSYDEYIRKSRTYQLLDWIKQARQN